MTLAIVGYIQREITDATTRCNEDEPFAHTTIGADRYDSLDDDQPRLP